MKKNKEHDQYLFQSKMEIHQCSSGVLSCYVLGNKVSLREKNLDSDFSSFILQYLDKPFSIKDMELFFKEKNRKYNFKNIFSELEKTGLIKKAKAEQTPSLVLVNCIDVAHDQLLGILKEFGLKCSLKLINSSMVKGGERGLSGIKNDQVIFVLSDFKNKHKVSELNLHFFKNGVFWCPIIIDRFGGYIGPLIHSVPAGPCFSCYEGKLYSSVKETLEDDHFPKLFSIFLRVALLEALKIATKVSPSQVIYSNLLEIDCFNHRSRKHYIFTNSNCTVCGF